MFKLKLVVLSLLFAQNSAYALTIPNLSQTTVGDQQISNDALKQTGLENFQDEVMSDTEVQLTDSQLHQAKIWGLSETEEKRYLKLLNSRSGIYYQGLRMTPVDILGLNARNDEERLRFAKIAAQQEAQKVSQNIAWNNAFYKAYNNLFKNVPVVGEVDLSPYSPLAHKPIELSAGSHLYLFIREDDPLKTILFQLYGAIKNSPNSKLHLMFLGMNEESIQLWANQNQIPFELVNAKQISLNAGELQYQKLKLEKKETPLLLLSKGKATHIVDLGRF